MGNTHPFVDESNCAVGVPPWGEFCRKSKRALPESIPKTAPS